MTRKTGMLGNEKIPMVRDVATWIYLEDPDMPGWSEQPITCILADLPWLEEGMEVELVFLDPKTPPMGQTKLVQVVTSKAFLQVHNGKYGQMQRRVLVAPIIDDGAFSTTSFQTLLARDSAPNPLEDEEFPPLETEVSHETDLSHHLPPK